MQDVRKDRHKYIGGSDIPIILGISPFKKRFDLLLEKAQLKEMDFEGNKYTAYGDEMEPKIREHINSVTEFNFVEHKVINKDMRYHADGYDEATNTVLEIKTTSQIKDNLAEYKVYLSQLIYGMSLYGAKFGILAVYERDEEFNTEFDKDRLTIYSIDIEDYRDLQDNITSAVMQFRTDLEKVKENPFITEQELQPNEIVAVANEILDLEEELQILKEQEKKLKSLKSKLKELMENHNIKKWETPNQTKITLVPDGEDKTVIEVDFKKLEEENKELVKKYEREVIKKGRSGYVKITLPKAQ